MKHNFAQCPHFGVCGGCSLRDKSYQEQLKYKKDMLGKEFEGLSLAGIEDVVPSPQVDFYRNRMDYVFGSFEGKLVLGLRQKGRFDKIVDIRNCYMLSPLACRIMDFTREYFNPRTAIGCGIRRKRSSFFRPKRFVNTIQYYLTFLIEKISTFFVSVLTPITVPGVNPNFLPAYDVKNHEGILRYLVLREGKNTGELLVNLVTADAPEKAVNRFAAEMKRSFSAISTFIWSVNEGLSDKSEGGIREVIFGNGYINDKIGRSMFRISPYSFFQTNTAGAEILYDYVKMLIDKISDNRRYLFDLYCGTGGFGLALAGMFKKVIGVEIYLKALEDAKINARANGVDNYLFINAKVEKMISNLRFSEDDIIILDPPRAGVQAKAARKINVSGVKNIIYVSCNPRSLRMDIDILSEEYNIESLQAFDMFPHTPHVECVVKLRRKERRVTC